MDHETAVRIQAAERYILEEFPAEERAAFEEHFFDCPECAEEVRSATIFAANAAAVLRDERAKESGRLARRASQPRWRFWVLAASGALNVALLVSFGVDRFGSQRSGASMEPQFYSTVAVTSASRGNQAAAAITKGAQFFGMRFDLMPGQHFESFEYQILDAKGAVRSAKSLPSPGGDVSELQLSVPVQELAPGEYVVVLHGGQAGSSTEIGRRSFLIPR